MDGYYAEIVREERGQDVPGIRTFNRRANGCHYPIVPAEQDVVDAVAGIIDGAGCAIPPVDVAGYAAKSASISRPNYGHYTGTGADVRRLSGMLLEGLRAGWLQVEAGQSVPLAQAAIAHEALEARQTTGSTLLLP